MDLKFTPEEQAFREEVQGFLKDKLPARIAQKVKAGQRLSKADQDEWHAILNSRGWFASHWPVQYGGPGWGPVKMFIFDNECALAGGPRIVPFGVSMLGPVLIKYGNEAQKQYWLPRMVNGIDWWCQGYSEPGSGSDLASVKTTAVRGSDAQGDHYIVNGQKTWTTQGQHANMIFCLVRTDKEARPQAGISFLMVDMATPGVEVRPIRTIDGDHEVNEVFLTDVRVPAENLVGEENKGWTYAKFLLTYERTGIAGVGMSAAALNKLKVVASKVQRSGRPLDQDPQFAARMARVEIDLIASKPPSPPVAEGSGGPAAAAVVDSQAAASTPATAAQAPVDTVVFQTGSAAWIQVIDANGQALVRKTVPAGETFGVTGDLPLRVTVGRADITKVSVRGEPLDLAPLTKGTVARFEVK